MSRPGLLAVICAVPLAAAVWVASGGSAEPRPRDVEGEIQGAIRADVDRLGSPDRSERLDAEQDLLDRGAGVLPLLPPTEEVRDPAARAGLRRIRERLEQRKAEESVRPTRLSVQVEGPLSEVAVLPLQATGPGLPLGIKVALTPEQSAREVSLKEVDQPFWKVIDEAGRQAGLWPVEIDPARRLTFREREPEDDARRVVYLQAFRVVTGPLSLKPVAGDETHSLLRVPVEIWPEPKLRPLFLFYSVNDFELTGPAGEVMPPFTPGAKYELPFRGAGDVVGLRLDHLASLNPAGPFKLSGKARLTVAAGEEWFYGYFQPLPTPGGGELAVNRTESRGRVAVRFREMTLRPDGTAEVEISVVYDRGGPAFESHRAWVYHNVAEIHYEAERDGEWTSYRLDHEPNFSTVAQSGGGFVLRYHFTGVPPEAKHVRFAYAAPTNVVEAPIEVAIDGLTVGDAEDEKP